MTTANEVFEGNGLAVWQGVQLGEVDGERRKELERMLSQALGAVGQVSDRGLRRSVNLFLQMLLSHANISDVHRGPWAMGGARFPEGSTAYEAIRLLVRAFAIGTRGHWRLVSGGGPGAMAAAAQGASEGGAKVVGCTLRLESWQQPSPADYSFMFDSAAPRKIRMTQLASAIFCFAGGFGTLDELFEVFVLRQHDKMDAMPIYCLGAGAWLEILQVITAKYLRLQSIAESDLRLFSVVDLHRLTVPPEEQRVSILKPGETILGLTQEPVIRVIGVGEWLKESVAFHNAQDLEYHADPADDQALEQSLALLEMLKVPAEW